MKIPEEVMYAWLAGALPPGRAFDVEAELRADPALQRRVQQLSAELTAAAAAETPRPQSASRWMLPPPGYGSGVEANVVGAMDSRRLPPGGRLRLSLPRNAEPAGGLVVVLWRGAGSWEVIFPRSPSEALDIRRLPRDQSGRRYLEVAARPGVSRQSWAMVIAPSEMWIDWEAPSEERWRPLRQALAAGQLQAGTATADVDV